MNGFITEWWPESKELPPTGVMYKSDHEFYLLSPNDPFLASKLNGNTLCLVEADPAKRHGELFSNTIRVVRELDWSLELRRTLVVKCLRRLLPRLKRHLQANDIECLKGILNGRICDVDIYEKLSCVVNRAYDTVHSHNIISGIVYATESFSLVRKLNKRTAVGDALMMIRMSIMYLDNKNMPALDEAKTGEKELAYHNKLIRRQWSI